MTAGKEPQRYIYKTEGVCPQEIHFRLDGERLQEIRFVGGGCPGNAELVSRLLEGRSATELGGLLDGVSCRNGTSCPDQLAFAIRSALNGRLRPTLPFNVHEAPSPCKRIGLIGDLGGQVRLLERLLSHMAEQEVETVFCLGNLTGPSLHNESALELIKKIGLTAIQGETDWKYAHGREAEGFPSMGRKGRDFLLRLPQVLSFAVGKKRGVAFFGDYLQRLSGFSDYDPFSLEINMVCGLSRFLEDTTVYPALEAMAPQFQAQVVVFSQPGKWVRRRMGGVDFIGVGAAASEEGPAWALLEADGEADIRVEWILTGE